MLGVHGHVVSGHSVGDGDEQEDNAGWYSFYQNETVERDGRAFDRRPVGGLYQGCRANADARSGQGTGKDGVERAMAIVHEQSHHRADGHGQIVGKPEVTESFTPAGGGHDVDDQCVASYRDGAEGQAMHDAQSDEHGQCAGQDVTQKHGGEDEVSQQIEGLAGKGVEQITRKRTHTKGRHRVATEDETDGGGAALENLAQIKRQHGDEQPESEKEHEVGHQHAPISRGEQFLFHNLVCVLTMCGHRDTETRRFFRFCVFAN